MLGHSSKVQHLMPDSPPQQSSIPACKLKLILSALRLRLQRTRLQLPSQQRRSADAASQAPAAVLAAAATQADGARTETQQQTEQPHSSCSLPESLVEATLVELEGRAAR